MEMGGYQYTLDNPFLDDGQRSFYEKNGYLIVKKLVGEDELAKYRQRFIDICDGRVKGGNMTIMRNKNHTGTAGEAQSNVYKIQDYQADPVLSEYFKLPQILKYVECFVGKDIAAVHTMLINKPPDCGNRISRHPLHQDLHYFPFRPADRIVCSWTAMEKVTRQNGCLVVIPGSHTGELLPHGYPEWDGGVNKAFHGIQGKINVEDLVHCEMEAGDTVFFHPILHHGSGSNTTKGYRKAISCHYSTCHSKYIDVRGTSQDNIYEEVMGMFRKRFPGVKVSFEDIWFFKRVVVQGNAESSKL